MDHNMGWRGRASACKMPVCPGDAIYQLNKV